MKRITQTPLKVVNKKQWAQAYRPQIMEMYMILQRHVDSQYSNVEWDTLSLSEFIDLIYENSSGVISPYL